MAKMDRKLVAKTQQYEVAYFAKKHSITAAEARGICNRPAAAVRRRTKWPRQAKRPSDMAMRSTSEIDAAVLAKINQRTLVGGTAIDIGPIAEQVGISAGQLADSIQRLRQRGLVTSGPGGGTASITPEGHAQL